MADRAFFSILSSDLPRARDWYTSLFGYVTVFESDWFIHLQDAENPSLELGLMDKNHEVVAERMRHCPTGGLLTIVVNDVDQLHARAVAGGLEVIEEPRDLFYGQRRMLLADPDGQIVDVSSQCAVGP